VLRLLGEQRQHVRQLVGVLDVRVARHRADFDRVVADVDVSEVLDLADVDDVVRRREPVRHDDPERLVARHQLRVRQLRQQLRRLLGRLRTVVLERCRFHRSTSVSLRGSILLPPGKRRVGS